MLIIDFTTPEWVKNLILSLQPIKNMHKHFTLPSSDPAKFIIHLEEAKEINYQKIEIDAKKAISKKIRNEFDENLERSTTSQEAKINYEQLLGKNKPNEEIMPKEGSQFQQSWNNDVRFNEEANLFGCNNMIADVY